MFRFKDVRKLHNMQQVNQRSKYVNEDQSNKSAEPLLKNRHLETFN